MGTPAATRSRRSRELHPGVDRRVRRADRRRADRVCEPGDTALFFNFRPDRAASSRAAARRGVDLTTMTRYRDELDCPVVFGSRTSRTRSPRCCPAPGCDSCTSPRPRSTRTSRISSTAAARTEWPGETRILVPSPRDVADATTRSRRCPPQVARALQRGDRHAATPSRGQLRQPGHGRAHRLDPGRDQGGRDSRHVPRRGRRPGPRRGGVCLMTADHGNAERMLEDDGVSPHTAHTTNPCRSSSPMPGPSCERAASSPISRRQCSPCSESRSRRR